MSTRTKTRTKTNTKTIAIAAAVVGLAAAAGLGYNMMRQQPTANKVVTPQVTLTMKFNGPASANIVKGTSKANFYAFSLTNSGADVQINSLRFTLSGVGSAKLLGSKGNKYFTNVKIMDADDGTTIMGPKEIAGNMAANSEPLNFADPFVLKAGATKNLLLVASVASAEDATGELIGNQYYAAWNPFVSGDITQGPAAAFDVAQTSPKSAVNGNPMKIVGNLTGSFSVQNLQTPKSTIVVAGKDVWVPFASYRVTDVSENLAIERIAVSHVYGGDNADFAQVAIASDGTVRGAAVFNSGATGIIDVDLSSNKITITKGGTKEFQIWAKLSPVMASAVVNGSWTGVARSGHMPALGLASNLQTGAWTSDYAGKLNIKAVGVQTANLFLAPVGMGESNGQMMRKSKPIVAKMNLPTNTLSNGELPLYNWSVGADSAGPIAIKQIMFRVDTSPNVKLSLFRLYRGSMPMSTQDYSIIDARTGINLVSSPSAVVDTVMVPTISFTNEQVVSGGNTQYSLRATISYTGTGNTVTTGFYRGLSDPIVTGMLTNQIEGQFNSTSPSIYNIVVPGSTGVSLGTFVWSDNSELPHSYTVSGSADWTNHVYVNDLTQSSALSN